MMRLTPLTKYVLPIAGVLLCCLSGCNQPSSPSAGKTENTQAGQSKHESGSPNKTTKTDVSANSSRKTSAEGINGSGTRPTGKPSGRLKPFIPPKVVRLDDITPQGLQDYLAKQRGRAVLVDYWATWCQPCQQAFPHTLELSRRHAQDGLVVVSLCVDEHENRQKALEFLKKSDARIINLYPSDKINPDKLYEAFNTSSFPMYRVYGPEGNLIAEIKSPENAAPGEFLKLLLPRIDAAVKKALGLQ